MGFDANAWRQAVSDRGGTEAPPDAEYDVELVDSKIATRERDGAQWVVLRWRVLSGRERDHEWESMHTIDATKPDGEPNPGLGYTIESLEKMGVDVMDLDTVDDLQAAAQSLEGGTYAVEVKRSGSFINTYPRRVLEQVAASLPGSGGAYGQAPASAPASAIYGEGDAPTPSGFVPARDEQLASQTTRAEMSGRQPERTGESDVTPALAAGEFSHPPADDDVPWTGESPPKRDDVNPATGEPFGF